MMIRTDATFLKSVDAAVGRIEAGTAAEVVVVAAQRSGSYRDVALVLGAVVAWLVFVAVAVSPIVFSALWTAVDVAIVFSGASLLAHRSPWLLARLVRSARKRRQCLDAARAIFLEEAVDRTAGRTGVLVYLSALERHVVVIPDAGVLGSVPAGDLAAVRWGFGRENESTSSPEEFLAGLESLGAVLAHRLPAPAVNPDESPNTPRVRR